MTRNSFFLFLRVSAALGAFFAVVEMAILLISPPSGPLQTALAQAAALGAVMGLGLGAITTSEALQQLKGRDWRPSDVTWFGRRQWTEVELPFGLLESLQIAEQELRASREVTQVMVDTQAQTVTARTAHARKPLGSYVTVSVAPVGALDAATTRARVESRPCLYVSLLDVGTGKHNVESIARALNQAVNRRLKAEREAAENAAMHAQLHQSRLALLQAQVEPHFLYNTLAQLQLLIRDDSRAAEKMAGDLIQYLRLSMRDFRESGFTLGREMDLVRAYLDIMKIRLGERLQVEIEVDAEAARRPFAPLLVHTLVENAIKHGIEPSPHGGRVSIVARCAPEGLLRVTVADTGLGLREGLAGSGVGLANLRERLMLLYGKHARFTLAPQAASGVACTLEIPPAAEPTA
jgi:signal transduction histidine kinase